jgi:hypothetical protein
MINVTYCKNCIFWDIIHAGTTTKAREGRCRRHAPIPRADKISRDLGTMWPATFGDDWCGEGRQAAEIVEAFLKDDPLLT